MTEAFVGRVALGLALTLAVYGAVASIAGGRGRPQLAASARSSAYGMLALVAVSTGALVTALVRNDFAVAYVAQHSNLATPVVWRVTALWSGDGGSLLLWNLALAGWVAAMAIALRRGRPAFAPWSLAVAFAVSACFLLLVVLPASPFVLSSVVPADGSGAPPLLQDHPLMAIHPPILYLGFVGTVVPFALAVGALLTGDRSEGWIASLRRWILADWCLLTAGIALGALWSYTVLGWGGYWAWDPVENLALLPWLATTASLHALHRPGTSRRWRPATATLAVAPFALVVLATSLTRGSLLVSVHAFADSPTQPLMMGFLAALFVGVGVLLAVRAPRLAPAATGRGGAERAGVALLVTAAAVVLAGTLTPLAIEAATGRQVAVLGSFFDRTVGPLVLAILALIAFGSRRSAAHLNAVHVVAAVGGIVVALVLSLGGSSPVASLALGVCAGSLLGIVAGAVSAGRDGLRGTWPSTVSHLGLAIAVTGIVVSTAFATDADVQLMRGGTTEAGGGVVTMRDLAITHDARRTLATATIEVSRGGASTTLTPGLASYAGADASPVARPALHVGGPFGSDVLASLIVVDGRRATVRLSTRPGATWIWIGAAIMVGGGLVRRRRRTSLATPAPASTSTPPERVLELA